MMVVLSQRYAQVILGCPLWATRLIGKKWYADQEEPTKAGGVGRPHDSGCVGVRADVMGQGRQGGLE